MKSFKEEIADALSPLLQSPPEQILSSVTLPPSRSQGDYAFPCFVLAKTHKKAPAIIAAELAEKIALPAAFDKAEAAGGYLNFFVNKPAFARSVLGRIVKEDREYGHNRQGAGKTVVLDFSSPNMGKELAFHHLRGTMLGRALACLYLASGYRVERVNHLGDWGTSYGKLIVMYLRSGRAEDKESLGRVTIEELNRLYKEFEEASRQDPELENRARETFQQLEAGNERHLNLWKAFRDITLSELRRLYDILGVEFEHYTGESFFLDRIPEVLNLLKEKGLSSQSQGALIVDLEKEGLPPLLLKKSDGSTLYATRDLAAALYRKQTYGFDRSLYVVDNGQSLHFQQIFSTLRKMGYGWADQCEHIPFGLVLNKSEEGKWEKGKTRTGRASLLKDVIDKAGERILEIIQEKNPALAGKEDLARKIAVGALVFNEMKNRRLNDIRFDWDKVLSFEGDTGPYVQNAHVRLCSILRKARGEDANRKLSADNLDFDKLIDPPSLDLIYLLSLFPDRLLSALSVDDPCGLGQYALEIAEATHGFLHSSRVLGSAEESERLYLVDCARIVLRNTFELLGVPVIEAM